MIPLLVACLHFPRLFCKCENSRGEFGNKNCLKSDPIKRQSLECDFHLRDLSLQFHDLIWNIHKLLEMYIFACLHKIKSDSREANMTAASELH